MKPMMNAILRAGIVTEEQLSEFRRFGAPIPATAKPDPPKDLETAASIIEEVLQSENLVLVRETDLEVLREYIKTSRQGLLHIAVEDGPSESTSAEFSVTYGRSRIGEYIIGWRGENIAQLMTNGLTYLVEDGKQVYFSDVRELFYDDQKAFMLCIPSSYEEPAGDSHGQPG